MDPATLITIILALVGVAIAAITERERLKSFFAERFGRKEPPVLRPFLRELARVGIEEPNEYELSPELTLRPVALTPKPSLEEELKARCSKLSKQTDDQQYRLKPNASIEGYRESFRSRWPEIRTRILLDGRLFKLWFAFENTGLLMAEDIDFRVDFPDGFEVYEDIPDSPSPEWPMERKPEPPSFTDILRPPPLPRISKDILFPNCPTVRVRGTTAIFWVDRLKQGKTFVGLPGIYVGVPLEKGTYAVPCTATAANIPGQSEGAITLLVDPVEGGRSIVRRHFEHLAWIHPPFSYAEFLDEDRGSDTP